MSHDNIHDINMDGNMNGKVSYSNTVWLGIYSSFMLNTVSHSNTVWLGYI